MPKPPPRKRVARPQDQSTLTQEGGLWVINLKFVWTGPTSRIHTERIELGNCSASDAAEAFEAVKAIMEIQFS